MKSEEHKTNVPEEESTSVNRRRFVKAMGATSATAGIGILSTDNASAEEQSLSKPIQKRLTRLQRTYDTANKARSAFEEHGNNVFEALANHRLIATSSVTALPTNELQTKQEYISTQQGMAIDTFVKQGTPTAHIFTATDLPEGRLVAVVQPQRNVSYATLYPDSDFWKNRQQLSDRGGLTTKMRENNSNKPLFIESTDSVSVAASSSNYCKSNSQCSCGPGCSTCCTNYRIVCVCGGGCADNDVRGCCSNGERCPCGNVC